MENMCVCVCVCACVVSGGYFWIRPAVNPDYNFHQLLTVFIRWQFYGDRLEIGSGLTHGKSAFLDHGSFWTSGLRFCFVSASLCYKSGCRKLTCFIDNHRRWALRVYIYNVCVCVCVCVLTSPASAWHRDHVRMRLSGVAPTTHYTVS